MNATQQHNAAHSLSRPLNFRFSWIGRWSKRERKLRLFQFGWERRKYSTYSENLVLASHKLSVSIIFEPRDFWVGLYWDKPRGNFDWFFYVCLIPLFPIRIHRQETWGGIIP